MVISNAPGSSVEVPPLHVTVEPTGGPLNRMFGGGHRRALAQRTSLVLNDRIPEPVMRVAMKSLQPPGR